MRSAPGRDSVFTLDRPLLVVSGSGTADLEATAQAMGFQLLGQPGLVEPAAGDDRSKLRREPPRSCAARDNGATPQAGPMPRKVIIPRVGSVVLAAAALLAAAWLLVSDRLARRDLQAALAIYAQHCATAGETILRRARGVDGILWMKWRGDLSADAFSDRSRLDDPYGHDCGLEECIARLLGVSYGDASDPEAARRHAAGFRWVETVDPGAATRYRYVAGIDVVHWRDAGEIAEARRSTGTEPGPAVYGYAVKRDEIEAFSARYGLRWNDISTPEDRAHWIAGSTLEIVDLQSGELIARRTGYMIDLLQGRHPDGTAPWLYALRAACPPFRPDEIVARPRERHGSTVRDFALRVLQ